MAKNAVYFAREGSMSFHVVVRDEKGEKVARLDSSGNPRYGIGGRKEYLTKLCRFAPYKNRSIKDPTDRSVRYITGNDPDVREQDEIEALDKMVADGMVSVMTEGSYRAKYEPVDVAKEEAARARARVEAAESETEKWKAEVERLKAEVAAKRGPGRPPNMRPEEAKV